MATARLSPSSRCRGCSWLCSSTGTGTAPSTGCCGRRPLFHPTLSLSLLLLRKPLLSLNPLRRLPLLLHHPRLSLRMTLGVVTFVAGIFLFTLLFVVVIAHVLLTYPPTTTTSLTVTATMPKSNITNTGMFPSKDPRSSTGLLWLLLMLVGMVTPSHGILTSLRAGSDLASFLALEGAVFVGSYVLGRYG